MASKELSILIRAKDFASRTIMGVRAQMKGLGSDVSKAAGNIVKNLAKIGVAAAGLAVVGLTYAVKEAASFEKAMTLISAQVEGVSAKDIPALSKAVLDMATKTATAPDELAAGLYHIESAGLKGAKALDALKVAADASKVSGAAMEDVSNALVGAIMTGIKGTEDYNKAMGILNATVGAGNMRMADLAAALSSGVMPAAKNFGLGMIDVGAALAQMADQAIPPEEAATRLRMTFSLLAAPTSKATKLLASIGMKGDQLAKDMRKPDGLLVALKDLQTHMGKMSKVEQAQFLSRAFGGGRSSTAIMTLLGNMDLLQSKYEAITKGEGDFATSVATTKKTTAYQWDQLKTDINVIAIKIGTALLPKVNQVVHALTEWVSTHGSVIDQIANTALEYFDKLGVFLKNLPWNSIKSAFKLMGEGAKAAMDLFLSAPPWLQTAIITGWGLNKLSGGMLGKIVGGLASGLIKGILGINAGVVNINAGVVNGGGGVGGVAGGGTSLMGNILKWVVGPVAAAAAGYAIGKTQFFNPTVQPAMNFEQKQFTNLPASGDPKVIQQRLDTINKGLDYLGANNPVGQLLFGDQIKLLQDQKDILQKQLDQVTRVNNADSARWTGLGDALKGNAAASQRMEALAKAIQSKKITFSPKINVTANITNKVSVSGVQVAQSTARIAGTNTIGGFTQSGDYFA